MGRRISGGTAAPVLALALALALTGCSLPVDPAGTLERARGGELRVGASPAGGLVVVDGDEVSGPLPELIEGFADSIDARVTWSVDSEEDLVDGLVAGDLDLAIGGMTETTPWIEQASVTRAYEGIPGADGAAVVVLLPLGENGLQAAVESYLDEEVGP